jgi:hypothetical protein
MTSSLKYSVLYFCANPLVFNGKSTSSIFMQNSVVNLGVKEL